MIPKIHMTRGDDEESLRFFCSMDRDHDKILTFLAHKNFIGFLVARRRGMGRA